MAYFDEDVAYTQTYRDWVNNSVNLWRYNRQTIIGPGIYMNSFANSVIQMQYARNAGADGLCTYSYNVTTDTTSTWTDWYPYVATNLFTSAASVPTMPWRDPATATEGTLYGQVTNASTGLPVDYAVVQVGSLGTIQTDANGYYIVTQIPATAGGTAYSVTGNKTGIGSATVNNVTVIAGSVRQQDLVLGAGEPAPIIAEVTPDPATATVGQAYSQQLTLTQGMATSWTLIEGPSGAQVNSSGLVSGWTPTAADVNQSFTFTVRATNGVGSDDETWQVNVPDTVPPSVTVEQAAGQADPTSSLPINFTVTFSESVTDFDSTDVVMGGTAGGVVFTVAGGGAAYTISVTDLTAAGTIQPTIPAGRVHDTAGNANTASTSVDNSVTFEAGAAPVIQSWASVRTHTGKGDFSIALPSAGDPAVEPRRDGVLKLLVDFNIAVQASDGTLDVGDVVVGDSGGALYTPTSVALTNGGLRLEVGFAAGVLPNARRYTFDLGGRFVETVAPHRLLQGDTDCEVRVLVGDVNGTASVNLIDVGAVKSKVSMTVDAATFRYDLNVDGNINLIDVGLCKSMSGSTVP